MTEVGTPERPFHILRGAADGTTLNLTLCGIPKRTLEADGRRVRRLPSVPTQEQQRAGGVPVVCAECQRLSDELGLVDPPESDNLPERTEQP